MREPRLDPKPETEQTRSENPKELNGDFKIVDLHGSWRNLEIELEVTKLKYQYDLNANRLLQSFIFEEFIILG